MKRRRKKPSPPDHTLRRLALDGRWAEVHELLAERIARDPHDAEARAEMERLQQGLPLRATESALVRKRREENEMREELAAGLAHFRSNPEASREWEPALLERCCKRVAAIRAALGKRLPAEEAQELEAWYASLANLWKQRQRQQRRRLACTIGLPLLTMAVLGTGTALRHRAESAAETLREAMEKPEPARVEHILGVVDSVINRQISSNLQSNIRLARLWLNRTRLLHRQVQAELSSLESGQKHINTLTLTQRAEMEHKLKDLPESLRTDLSKRWQRLCQREARALARQQEEALQRFRTPLPPLPELSGPPAEDDKRLREQQAQLEGLNAEWEAARELFNADTALGQPIKTRLEDIRQLRRDIAALRRTVALLPAARSYAQYRQLLEEHAPQRYAPALRMMSIREMLPEEDKLRDQMQDHGRQLPPGMLEAARHALLDGGPSFPPAFPANAQQVQLMEDLFTYTGLQKVLYEMSAATLPSVIVEERPQPTEESVSFTPSPLTPGYTLDTPHRITWHNPQAVYIRRIDATPLLRETGISRENFFACGNLPALLDAVLRVDHEACPALARAYVFKRLLEVMKAHEWPTMLGIAYAPTLRADSRSFSKLVHGLGLPLEAGCWLLSTPEANQAEEACARWLHEHRHRHYAQEIARNFGSLVQVHPRYVGFVDEGGKAQLYRQLPAGTLLWYMAEGGLTTTPLGEPLEAPVSWSPVFIVAKD